MSIYDILEPFFKGTCSVQISSNTLHAPIYGCRLTIEDERLIIQPNILFDDFRDDLLLCNLEIGDFNGSDLITLKVNSTSTLKSLRIMKEHHSS